MRVIFRVIVVILLTGIVSGAGVAQKVGTTSLQFLKVMPTARATGMGEAFVAVPSGVDAVFWNPAGIMEVSGVEASLTHTLWIFDTKQNALAYGLSLGDWGNIGAQFQFTDIGAIEETRADHAKFVLSGTEFSYHPGLTGQTFTPISIAAGVTYARSMTDKFSAGLTMKYVYESLWKSGTAQVRIISETDTTVETYDTFTSALLFDFGILYKTGFRSTIIGASVQNFGPQVKYAKDRFSAPLVFRLGVSTNLLGPSALFVEDPNNRLMISYDILQPNDFDQQMHVGLEYEFGSLLSFRGGYKLNYDADRWTFGGGVKTDLIGFHLGLDYSYGEMGTFLGKVHRISMGVKFR